jgi:hypothetical protein
MTEIPITNAEIVAAIVSIPATVALSALVNSVLQVSSRLKPVVVLVVAEVLALFGAYILNGDWKLAVAKGILVGLVASGFYSQTKAVTQ